MNKSRIGLFTFALCSMVSMAQVSAGDHALTGKWPSNNGGADPITGNVNNHNVFPPSNFDPTCISTTPEWTTPNITDLPGDPYTTWCNVKRSVVQSSAVVDNDNNIYVADAQGIAYSYRPDGTLRWKTKLKHHGCFKEYFIESPVLNEDTVFIGGSKLHALNKDTGEERCSCYFDDAIADGHFLGDFSSIEPSQMMLAGNNVIYGIGHAEEVREGTDDQVYPFVVGKIVAFDQDTCQRKWSFINRAGGTVDDDQYGPGVGTYAGGAVDKDRKLLFWGVGQNYRPPVSPFSNALFAIDYRTGELKWHYQFVQDNLDDTCGVSPEGEFFCRLDGTTDLNVSSHPQLFQVKKPNDSSKTWDVVGARGKDGTYRIFKRDQPNYDRNDPNSVQPIAAIQLDPGAAWNPAIGAEVIYDATKGESGYLYIPSSFYLIPKSEGEANVPYEIDPEGVPYGISLNVPTSAVWPDGPEGEMADISNPYNKQKYIHKTADRMPGLNNFYESVTITCIDVQKLVNYFANKSYKLASAPYNIEPSVANGKSIPVDNDIIVWRKFFPQSSVLSSSGLSLIDGYIVYGDLNGSLRFLDAANGNQVGPTITMDYTTPLMEGFEAYGMPHIPILGGITAVDGRLIVPMGYDFQAFKTDCGGLAAYKFTP